MTNVAIIIPFRDRGIDPRRGANLEAVVKWWESSPWSVHVVSDGREGDAQFNRSAAYNIGAHESAADVLVYTESDMLIAYEQIEKAIAKAIRRPGLVVPFTKYCYMSEQDSETIRETLDPQPHTPESTMDNGASIGAVNVVTRKTLSLIGGGYTELTEGNWYDDNIMHRAFDVCAGQTRWVDGPAYHLYHLPGWQGDHLTDADRRATANNLALWNKIQEAGNDAKKIRRLLHKDEA